MLLVLAVAFLWWFLDREEVKGKAQLDATNAWCDAGHAFGEWRDHNQGVYIGLSPEGRKLVAVWLQAYDEFLKTHPFIDGLEHREWIRKLFYDLPPNYPSKIPRGKKKGARKDALFVRRCELLSL